METGPKPVWHLFELPAPHHRAVSMRMSPDMHPWLGAMVPEPVLRVLLVECSRGAGSHMCGTNRMPRAIPRQHHQQTVPAGLGNLECTLASLSESEEAHRRELEEIIQEFDTVLQETGSELPCTYPRGYKLNKCKSLLTA